MPIARLRKNGFLNWLMQTNMNDQLKELCRLNNVGLFLTATLEKVEWHACECLLVNGQDTQTRSGFGESPEVAIADCKQQQFRPLEK